MEAEGYKAYKASSLFVRYMEIPTILEGLGDLKGCSVLDQGSTPLPC